MVLRTCGEYDWEQRGCEHALFCEVGELCAFTYPAGQVHKRWHHNHLRKAQRPGTLAKGHRAAGAEKPPSWYLRGPAKNPGGRPWRLFPSVWLCPSVPCQPSGWCLGRTFTLYRFTARASSHFAVPIGRQRNSRSAGRCCAEPSRKGSRLSPWNV